MKKVIIITICLLFISVIGTMAQEKTVNIVSVPWPPYYDQYLPDYGLSCKIITAIYAAQGYKVNFHFRAWVQCMELVKKGEFDGVGTSYFTEERAKIYHYSEPYLECPIVFFKRKDQSITWKNYEDLKPYRIGIVRGYANPAAFEKADFLNKRVARDPVLNFKKLLLKQVDLIVSEKFVGNHILQTKLPDHEKELFEPISPPLDMNKIYIMFSKKVSDIQPKMDAFNAGLEIIKSNGTLQQIISEFGIKK